MAISQSSSHGQLVQGMSIQCYATHSQTIPTANIKKTVIFLSIKWHEFEERLIIKIIKAGNKWVDKKGSNKKLW